jgi:hypothetical protein
MISDLLGALAGVMPSRYASDVLKKGKELEQVAKYLRSL